ncbi:ferrous iron transport protein B [Planctomycetales bacterium]|nr:ferrous iron transport protein B [Planctomycetales bacterium]
MHEHLEVLAALVGQPNCGKSSVFNYLTGLHQAVGNYPGVTVTKKSGHYHDGDRRIEVVDLPGTYSLTSYSQEERVTRDFLLLERPEVVVLIIDAANLRRSLYLAFQLRELQMPLVVCLNMMDIAERSGIQVDVSKLELFLGVPVIPSIAKIGITGIPKCPSGCFHHRHCGTNQHEKNHNELQQLPALAETCGVPECRNTGLEALRKEINEISKEHAHEAPVDWKLDYGQLEALIGEIDGLLAEHATIVQDFPTRWLAIKLLENDREARRIIQHHLHEDGWETILHDCVKKADSYTQMTGESPRKTIAAARNQNAAKVESEVIHRTSKPRRNSDKLDKVFCHPFFGLISVAAVMYLMFELAFNLADGWNWFPWFSPSTENTGNITFELSTPFGAVDSIFSVWIPKLLDTFNLPDGGWHSLIYDGIVAGIGGVITFVPTIFFIFLFMSILDHSGYIARVVVVLDRIMRKFNLHGQSILPLILGGGIVGGCALPAVMATRTMHQQRERLLTILVIPLMNCGAKVPVFALFISAFFLQYKGLMLAAIIFISWAAALLAAAVLGKLFIKGEPSPLVIELPAYQLPTFRDVLLTASLQSWWFLKKAGTIILAVNILLWALMYFPSNGNVSESYAAKGGKALEPVSQLAGFDWRDNIALIGGFAAKEVIVTTMATMYGIEEDTVVSVSEGEAPVSEEAAGVNALPLTQSSAEIEDDNLDDTGKRLALKLRDEVNWSPLKAFSMLLFVMFYSPCFATCAVIWKETGYIKYMLLSLFYTNILAITAAVAVYQIGLLLGF